MKPLILDKETKDYNLVYGFVVTFAAFLFKITPKTLLERNPDRGVYLVLEKTDESSSFEYTVDKAEKVEKDYYHFTR